MKCTVKKLYKGHVSIRDYVIQKCKDKQEDLIVSYKYWTMTIPFSELDKGIKMTIDEFSSQYNNTQCYTLIDFPFKADIFDTKL